MCKFVVIDSYGNSRIVEAVDMFEAVEEAWNNNTGYTHIESITRIPTEESLKGASRLTVLSRLRSGFRLLGE